MPSSIVSRELCLTIRATSLWQSPISIWRFTLTPNFEGAYIDRAVALYRMRQFNRAFADIGLSQAHRKNLTELQLRLRCRAYQTTMRIGFRIALARSRPRQSTSDSTERRLPGDLILSVNPSQIFIYFLSNRIVAVIGDRLIVWCRMLADAD